MNITRRIHLNPQSKGNFGKSFEAEFRAAWLDQLGVQWNGSDLDDRHRTFASRHKAVVRSYQLGNEHESKTALLRACFENISGGLAAGRGDWLRCSSVADFSRICALVAPRHPPRRARNPDSELFSKHALSPFRRVLKDTAPVHVIDTRAQADALIMAELEELQVLDVCAEQDVRLDLFPVSDR